MNKKIIYSKARNIESLENKINKILKNNTVIEIGQLTIDTSINNKEITQDYKFFQYIIVKEENDTNN
jgi:hypothetical protein